MKKKGLLGILAVLMMFALALTGCGQQGEQNAGATGSESQNEAIGNEDNSAGEVTTELEETPDISQTGNQNPTKDVNGNYIYLITVDDVQTEIKTCVNVWDYITDGTPYDQVDLNQMLTDLGWNTFDGGTGVGTYMYNNGDCVKITPWTGKSEYDLPTGEHRVYTYTVAPWKTPDLNEKIWVNIICESVAEEPYIVKGTNDYVSFDEIVAYAHMVDLFRESVEPNLAFENDACIP